MIQIGTATITNSTFDHNPALGAGGGIEHHDGNLTLTSAVIANSTAEGVSDPRKHAPGTL